MNTCNLGSCFNYRHLITWHIIFIVIVTVIFHSGLNITNIARTAMRYSQYKVWVVNQIRSSQISWRIQIVLLQQRNTTAFRRLKTRSNGTEVIFAGRLFHMLAPAVGKALARYILYQLCTASSFWGIALKYNHFLIFATFCILNISIVNSKLLLLSLSLMIKY